MSVTAKWAGAFSGSNYLSVANYTGNPAAFSVACWVNPSATQLSRIFFSNFLNDGSNKGWAVGISDSTNNKIKFYLGSNTLFQSGTLTNNVWAFVLFTWDGTTAKIYLNGATTPDATLTSGVVYGSVPASNYIGTLDTTRQDWNGGVGALGYWSRALTGAEGATLYNSGTGLAFADLTGSLLTSLGSYHDFADASNLGLDSSANARNFANTGSVARAAGPDFWAAGVGGRGSSSGSAALDFGATNVLSGATTAFWSFWLKVASWPGAVDVFFAKDSTGGGWSVQHHTTFGANALALTSYNSGGAGTEGQVASLAAPPFDWTHVGVYLDSSGVAHGYVGGAAALTTGALAGNPYSNTTNGTAANPVGPGAAVAELSLYKNPTQGQADTLAANLAAGRSPFAQAVAPVFYCKTNSGTGTETDLAGGLTAAAPGTSTSTLGLAVDSPYGAALRRRLICSGVE